MRCIPLPFIVVVSVALGACASRTASPPLTPDHLRAIGAAIAEQPCTDPLAVRSRSVQNTHDASITDQVVETVCAGVTAQVYRANAKPGPRVLPVRLVFSQADPRLPPSLRIGASVDALASALGQPGAVGAKGWTYPMSSDRAGDEVVFEHERGRIVRATWSWSVD